MTIHWKAIEQYFTVVLFFNFTQFVILQNLSILDLALSRVKGLTIVCYVFAAGFNQDIQCTTARVDYTLILRWSSVGTS